MKRLTAEWVRKAEADLRGARRLSKESPPLHDLVCFHCQQAAEKYLKAILEEAGRTVPRTHDLEDLLTLLVPHHGALRSLHRGALFLTRFAVEPRYPEKHTTKRQAQAALRWAERVRASCRAVLGLHSRPGLYRKSP